MGNENFKDVIHTEIGEIPLSDTQKYRVLIVEDDNNDGMPAISLQKWWRTSKDSDWLVGKGFKLTSDESDKIADLLNSASIELRKVFASK